MPSSPSSSGHGGGGSGPAAGTYLPAANAASVTVDTSTYNDPIRGGGAKLTTLVFPASHNQSALAIALAGDAFPRWVMSGDPSDGLFMSDGTYDPSLGNNFMCLGSGAANEGVDVGFAGAPLSAPRLSQVSPLHTITSGALPTVQLVSATGAQVSTVSDVEAHTPVTFNPGAATTATCTVALSPDNVTYSTLAVVTFPVGVVFDGSIRDIAVRVPAGWYLKLTVSATATLGVTTYY